VATEKSSRRAEERIKRKAAAAKGGDALRDYIVESVTDRITEKVERKSAQAARKSAQAAQRAEALAAKATMKAEALERIASHLSALDIWTRVEPGARRPRFTRDELARTAVRIADREGFDALSMRRLAAELDAGTMTLYHYVRTKDELLTLVLDEIMGEVVVPDNEDIPADWRAALHMIAERSRASLERHPWILDMIDDPPIGPNSVRHFDQSLQAVASLPISLSEKLDVVFTVDEYVFGYCLQQRNNVQTADSRSDTAMVDYVTGLLATGDYPHLSALADEMGIDAAWKQIEAQMRDTTRFSRNLDRLLDGIEAGLPRA
jgi:AcrR family transcriptional regulator